MSPGCESFRYSGLVLQVNIEYANKKPSPFDLRESRVYYRFTVDHVQKSEYQVRTRCLLAPTVARSAGCLTPRPRAQANEVIPDPDPGTGRTVNNRHGLRIMFRQIGEVGTADLQTFLVNMVAAMGLLAGATAVVDTLMVYVLEEKERYKQAKVTDVAINAAGSDFVPAAAGPTAGALKAPLAGGSG